MKKIYFLYILVIFISTLYFKKHFDYVGEKLDHQYYFNKYISIKNLYLFSSYNTHLIKNFIDSVTFDQNIRLIYVVSKDHCHSCIVSEIDHIYSISKVIGFDKVLIITDFTNDKDVKYFISTYKIKSKVLNFNITNFKSIIFILKGNKIINSFIPPSDNEDLMNEYFNNLLKNL